MVGSTAQPQASSNGTIQAPSELQAIQGILSILGGGGQTQGTTASAGDTTALQAVLGQLQGANYEQMLQQIFQQAGAQIPRFQAAFGNAMGARSGSNSAMATALQELLKATTIEAQNNLATQQLNNTNQQVQAGSAIANATKGTQVTTKTAANSQLGQLAAMIGLAQAGMKLTGSKTIQEMFGKATGVGDTPVTQNTPPVADAVVQNVAPQVTSAPDVGPLDALSQYFNLGGSDGSLGQLDSGATATPVDSGSVPGFDLGALPVDGGVTMGSDGSGIDWSGMFNNPEDFWYM